jgi:hypothetical protein
MVHTHRYYHVKVWHSPFCAWEWDLVLMVSRVAWRALMLDDGYMFRGIVYCIPINLISL